MAGVGWRLWGSLGSSDLIRSNTECIRVPIYVVQIALLKTKPISMKKEKEAGLCFRYRQTRKPVFFCAFLLDRLIFRLVAFL